jgi:hypothetical protein
MIHFTAGQGLLRLLAVPPVLNCTRTPAATPLLSTHIMCRAAAVAGEGFSTYMVTHA